MPRAGLSTELVVAAAAELADERGFDGVTLALLAERLGVRPPSLYAHVRGLDDLRARLAARGAEQLAVRLEAAAAGLAGGEALAAVANAYRAYAHAHPGAYAALQRASGSDAPDGEAAARAVAVVLAVLSGYGLRGDPALHATRAIRAALHGFVLLEAQEDASFAKLVSLLDSGLRTA
jgi:AcrR family transcriptional regulator